MWVAWIVAAIALTGAAFMLRVLVAFLGEHEPSVCYWVVPVRTEPLREVLGMWSGTCLGDSLPPVCDGGDYCVELLENENYAKEERSSGLIALDVRPVSNRLGWGSIHSRRGYTFREHRP